MPTLVSPLISIGIPTYNRPRQLRHALASIMGQTYPHIEVIVADNCSPGTETQEVVKEFMKQDSRIRYVRQSNNIGMFHNFKWVLEVAQGDYFAWLADDDTRERNFLAKCLAIFQHPDQSADLVLVNSYSQLVQADGNTTDQGCTTLGLSPAERYYQYLSSVYTTQSAIGDLIHGVMKRPVAQAVMRSQKNILGWDRVFLSALCLEGEFYTIPEVLMYSAPGGMSTMKNAQKMAVVQGIENPLYIRKAKWIRMFSLQTLAWRSPHLSLWPKLRLFAWLWMDMLARTMLRRSGQ